MAKFTQDNVVKLKGGGPKMTVSFVDGLYIRCKWIVGEGVASAHFHETLIEACGQHGKEMPENSVPTCSSGCRTVGC